MRHIRRRVTLFPILAVMANRGLGLLRQPFPELHVPPFYAWCFLAGAGFLLITWLRPARWAPWALPYAAAAAGGPYILFVSWGLREVPLSRFHVTAGDLLLVPYLIAISWGRMSRNDAHP